MNAPPRVVPIVPAVAAAASVRHDTRNPGDGGQSPRHDGHSPDTAPPCWLHVADTAISEADIAREMQHHPAARPQQSRADAARALVVRELLRREIQRLAPTATPAAGETDEEAQIRTLLEQALNKLPEPGDTQCRHYYEHHQQRLRTSKGQTLSFAQARPRIREYLAVQARQHAVWRYLKHLAGRYPVRGLAEIEAQAQ